MSGIPNILQRKFYYYITYIYSRGERTGTTRILFSSTTPIDIVDATNYVAKKEKTSTCKVIVCSIIPITEDDCKCISTLIDNPIDYSENKRKGDE